MKHCLYGLFSFVGFPAAFRRLCVETTTFVFKELGFNQPPSGGCVLKHLPARLRRHPRRQPPSGGCVLKLLLLPKLNDNPKPAAFRRLCVETGCISKHADRAYQPPSGGCVLKLRNRRYRNHEHPQPPSGGCVLKPRSIISYVGYFNQPPSGGCVLKLLHLDNSFHLYAQPPSGGCVLKRGNALYFG